MSGLTINTTQIKAAETLGDLKYGQWRKGNVVSRKNRKNRSASRKNRSASRKNRSASRKNRKNRKDRR